MSNFRSLLLNIMNTYLEAKREPFTGHVLGSTLRHELPSIIKKNSYINSDMYMVKGSVGQGNWATIPWLAIMNKKITTSTQRGYYIVYLFSENMEKLYLTFAQGVTETSKEEMIHINSKIRTNIKMKEHFIKNKDLSLGSSSLAKKYEDSVAAYVEYTKNDFPTEEQLLGDLFDMMKYYEAFIELQEKGETKLPIINNNKYQVNELVTHIHNYINNKGFIFSNENIINLFVSLKTKPFVILSGISGTGKTKIVQLFAESLGATTENGQYKLIPVRPDWSDGSDLIGFEDLSGRFKPGPLTEVLIEANKPENRDKPYFILLDEMNLARVEYYFSDLLSIMETKKFVDGEINSDPVIDREETGKLMLLDNVYIIGTVNMDETTHPFSKKVLDRANTIEYNEVYLDNFSFLNEHEDVDPIIISNKQLASKYIHLKDSYIGHEDLVQEVTNELVRINKFLEKIQSQFAYRVRDEICFYMIYNEEFNLLEKESAFDLQIYQKILPRITGNDAGTEKALKELFTFCTGYSWDSQPDRDVIFKEARFPKSAQKIDIMIKKIESEGFTSFWLG